MEQTQILDLFLNIAKSIPGIKEIHNLSKLDNAIINQSEIIEKERVSVMKNKDGYDFFITVTLLLDIPVKGVVAEFHQRLAYELKKIDCNLNKLTIIVKGVK